NRLRIINACIGKARLLSKLRRAGFGDLGHLRLGAEVQATSRTGFDTSGFKSDADSVRTQRALENFLCGRIEFGDIEGTPGNAILTADAVLLVEGDYAVGVLNDRAIGWARTQT